MLRCIRVGGVGVIQQRWRKKRGKMDGEPYQEQDGPGAACGKETGRCNIGVHRKYDGT